jgi:hypothetical protein
MFVTYLGPIESSQTFELDFNINALFDSNKLQNASKVHSRSTESINDYL